MRKIVFAGAALLLLGGGRTGMAAELAAPVRAPGDTVPRYIVSPEEAEGLPTGAGAVLLARGLPEQDASPQGAAPQLGSSSAQGLDVRIWTEDERDLFRAGERTRVLLRTSRDAYVAVLHVDTRGDIEVLFPASARDEGLVRARRPYAVGSDAGTRQHFAVSGSPGIGYVYAVASEEPLDLRAIRGLFPGHRGTWEGDRVVYGDPFETLDRIADGLLNGVSDGAWAEDWYTYHVGRRYTHPRYACYDAYGSWYHGTSPVYGSCDRVRILLRDHPYYYDTRHYRGDRRVIYARNEPRHQYKERVDARDADAGERRRLPSGRASGRDADEAPPPRRSFRGDGDAPRTASPAAPRQRPTLERRRPESSGSGRTVPVTGRSSGSGGRVRSGGSDSRGSARPSSGGGSARPSSGGSSSSPRVQTSSGEGSSREGSVQEKP